MYYVDLVRFILECQREINFSKDFIDQCTKSASRKDSGQRRGSEWLQLPGLMELELANVVDNTDFLNCVSNEYMNMDTVGL